MFAHLLLDILFIHFAVKADRTIIKGAYMKLKCELALGGSDSGSDGLELGIDSELEGLFEVEPLHLLPRFDKQGDDQNEDVCQDRHIDSPIDDFPYGNDLLSGYCIIL